MLSLQSESRQRWLKQVDQHLELILIDHAHCEKKAAACAMNLILAYIDRTELCRELSEIVREELEHFNQVLDLLEQRKIPFRRLQPGFYGRQLNDLVRKHEPERAIYGSLFESEARHHTTYVRMAKQFGSEEAVKQRLEELSALEAEIIHQGDPLPRMHS